MKEYIWWGLQTNLKQLKTKGRMLVLQTWRGTDQARASGGSSCSGQFRIHTLHSTVAPCRLAKERMRKLQDQDSTIRQLRPSLLWEYERGKSDVSGWIKTSYIVVCSACAAFLPPQCKLCSQSWAPSGARGTFKFSLGCFLTQPCLKGSNRMVMPAGLQAWCLLSSIASS